MDVVKNLRVYELSLIAITIKEFKIEYSLTVFLC